MSSKTENCQCISSLCIDDKDKYTLECTNCKRLVHYRCTQLPSYQIQRFLTKGYRSFMCKNCVETPEYLDEDLFNTPTTKSQSEHQEDKNKLKECAEELKRIKERQVEDNELAEKLQREIKACENIIKAHEENEIKLRSRIEELETDINIQEQTFNEIGNPEFDTIKKLENTMIKKLQSVGESIKESILQVVNANNLQLEDKLQSVTKTYAGTVKGQEQAEKTTQPANEQTDLRIIMKEARNEEVAEENEKKLRSKNFIIHGLTEGATTDNQFVNDFILQLGVTAVVKKLVRLGKADSMNKRPLKVEMQSEEDKRRIMVNLSNLRDIPQFKGISIKDDYTIAERQLLKQWNERAKEKTREDETEFEWRVRGTPKNGLWLKRMKRKGTTASP